MSSRLLRAAAGASAITLAVGVVGATTTAWADNPLTPRTTFTMVVNPVDGTVPTPTDGEAIPNIDSVKSTIRAYYNAPASGANKGVPDPTSSRYITQVHAIENQILKSLPATHPANQAVVFDVDDTLLWNYEFEDKTTNFIFNEDTNQTAVLAGSFPAVPGMPQLLRTLYDRGYVLYGVTGRPGLGYPNANKPNLVDQEPATLANLAAKGFTQDGTPGGTPLFTAANLYTKDAAFPVVGPPQTIPTQPWVDCSADGADATRCSTVEYKALTRQHIETTDGVDIVMNVGDQWSDLQGGYADDWTKIPNPTYFLASPDLLTAPASDANMVAPTNYVMQPDGSSGYSVASGDDIPNIDPLRVMIRKYYNATNGIANKATSPYITQLSSLETAWTTQVTSNCTSRSQAHNTAVQKQTDAQKAVDAAQAAADKAAKAVAKAKKQVKKAKTPQQRHKAQRKLKKAQKALKQAQADLAAAQKTLDGITVPPAPAVVFDADDTTLWTYDMEDGAMKFNFDPALQATWVSGHLFPATPGMTTLVKAANTAGCTVFGLTGRGASQQADTIANLTEQGYVDGANKPLFTASHYFTKGAVVVAGGDASIPTQPWVDCGGDGACSTIEYKSATRGHIEDDLGFMIVGNFGDQFSDLIGGHSTHTYKLPNPTYYLP